MSFQISKSQFKPKALEYLRLVESNKQKLVITHLGQPVVDILPHQNTSDENPISKLKNTVLAYAGPFESVGLVEWEALK